MLASYFGGAPSATDPLILAAHRAEYIGLINSAVAALERRRAAGTLLEGKCAAPEEAWLASQVQRFNAAWPADMAASWAALVGYEEFMHAATCAAEALTLANLLAAECSPAQFQSLAQFVVDAADLMQQPRRHGRTGMQYEMEFTCALHGAVADASVNGLDTRLLQRLVGAWKRLQRSGVLEARHIEESFRLKLPEMRAQLATVQKSLAAPGLRRCALPGCGASEAHPTHFKSCAACRTVVYCRREHQVAGWPSHKKACKAARKAAAAEDETGPSGT